MSPMEKIEQIGILPVISLKKQESALPLAQALIAGGIPAVEITLRTARALSCIREISQAYPEMVIGAGTVMTFAQADAAIEAGASFLVSPGFSEELVKYCLEKEYPIVPGCSTGSEITSAVELGLQTLKFFPAEPSGGLAALKLLSGPFAGVRFIPTGGMTLDNIGSYLCHDFIAACGGSFMAKADDIEQGRFDQITEKCRRCVDISLGLELAHVGINMKDAATAQSCAGQLASLFRMPVKVGNSSTFAARAVEFMHTEYYGEKGHIGFFTNSVARALAYYRCQGIAIREESVRRDAAGRLVSFYLQDEIGGFAVHVVRR